MTKRAYKKFERNDRDFYATPPEATTPLLWHLNQKTVYIEPCCGEYDLILSLQDAGHICISATDIKKQPDKDATYFRYDVSKVDCFITNPPWGRKTLHAIIENLSNQAPTWLLFDADWMHTKQAAPFMPRLKKIVSVGRVSWFGDTVGFDNCAWYLFDKPSSGLPVFVGRTPFEPTIVS